MRYGITNAKFASGNVRDRTVCIIVLQDIFTTVRPLVKEYLIPVNKERYRYMYEFVEWAVNIASTGLQ